MAFSAGFHPHPKISYANAAPTGAASEAEYLEIAVTERVDPERLRDALDDALPAGLDVLRSSRPRPARSPTGSQASDWVIEFRRPAAGRGWRRRSQALLAARRVEVTRMTKTGLRTFDARAAVVSLRRLQPPGGRLVCDTADWSYGTPHRPYDPTTSSTALHEVADLAPPTPPLVTRLAQGPLRTRNRDGGRPTWPPTGTPTAPEVGDARSPREPPEM